MPVSPRRPISRAQCDRAAEPQVYPGVRSCAGAATPRLKLSSPSFCGSSTPGSACRGAHPVPSLVPYLVLCGLASIPKFTQQGWAALLDSGIRFLDSQLFRCVALPAHPAARDKGPRSASPRRALQSESSPEPAGGWKKCELPAVRDDKGPGECAAPPPEPGLLQRPRPRPAAAWAKGTTCPSGEPPVRHALL